MPHGNVQAHFSFVCITYKFSSPPLISPPTITFSLQCLRLIHLFPTPSSSSSSSEISPISSQMGCCVSTVDTSKPHPNAIKNPHQHHPRSALQKSNATSEVESRSPPAAEEETVKEVLSETPISKSHSPFLPAETETQIPTIQHDTFQFDEIFPTPQAPLSLEETKIRIPIIAPSPPPQRFDSKDKEDVSHLSEMCSSVTESFSTTTTVTIGEKREDEVTSKRSSREATTQRSNAPRKRPYTVDGSSARERRSKSPATRADPSPEKRNPRTIRGRESGQTTNRKPHVGPTGVRRDAGEKSGRRSRSPSTTRLNQSRVNGGGRSQVKPPCEAVENEGREKMEGGNDGVPLESIENPHVSMECFIFL